MWDKCVRFKLTVNFKVEKLPVTIIKPQTFWAIVHEKVDFPHCTFICHSCKASFYLAFNMNVEAHYI